MWRKLLPVDLLHQSVVQCRFCLPPPLLLGDLRQRVALDLLQRQTILAVLATGPRARRRLDLRLSAEVVVVATPAPAGTPAAPVGLAGELRERSVNTQAEAVRRLSSWRAARGGLSLPWGAGPQLSLSAKAMPPTLSSALRSCESGRNITHLRAHHSQSTRRTPSAPGVGRRGPRRDGGTLAMARRAQAANNALV